MIEVRNLVKKYGDHPAVDGLSFTVERGQIYGFLGPNGAGKSTTMNIITGCLAATSGDVLINGYDIYKQPRKAKASIGYLPEIPPLYPDMTPQEYLLYVAELKGVAKKERTAAVQDVVERTGLADVRDRLIKNLSKGYKQRVGLAQAILGDPEVIILDEPTVGLDPAQIIEIRNVIRSLGETHTVIFSSHILSEVSEICNRILIISGGKLVAEDTPENLESRFIAKPVLQLTVKGDAENVAQALSDIEGIESVEVSETAEDGTTEAAVACEKGVDVKEAVSRALVEKNCFVLKLEESKASLEDVFMELISQEPEVPAEEESEEDVPEEEAPEMDAEALLNGTMESAYAAHEAFDAQTEAAESEQEEGNDDAGDL